MRVCQRRGIVGAVTLLLCILPAPDAFEWEHPTRPIGLHARVL